MWKMKELIQIGMWKVGIKRSFMSLCFEQAYFQAC
jgi:hypothetical protein